jgi:hypothetical protein
VNPLAFVRTVTPTTLAVFTPAAVAAAVPEADALLLAGALVLVGALVVGALLAELLDELHAASAARPAAAAGITSIARRRRFGTSSLPCEVITSFPRSSLVIGLCPCTVASPSRAKRRRRVRLAADGMGGVALGRPRRGRRTLRGADRYGPGCAELPSRR